MAEFLVLTLAAPMGSFGDLAGHERRGSGSWPTRSAILGLIGAALGVRRDDAATQKALDDWRMAVAVLTSGISFRDFHTAQTVPSTIKRPNSRREALAAAQARGNLNTMLTSRDYVTDCGYAVVLWGGEAPPLAEALKRPVFVPYLGRKSCPLAAPMAPRIVEALSPVEALAQAQLPDWMREARMATIASDPYAGMQADRIETRWDQPLDRGAWQFRLRHVHILEREIAY